MLSGLLVGLTFTTFCAIFGVVVMYFRFARPSKFSALDAEMQKRLEADRSTLQRTPVE